MVDQNRAVLRSCVFPNFCIPLFLKNDGYWGLFLTVTLSGFWLKSKIKVTIAKKLGSIFTLIEG